MTGSCVLERGFPFLIIVLLLFCKFISYFIAFDFFSNWASLPYSSSIKELHHIVSKSSLGLDHNIGWMFYYYYDYYYYKQLIMRSQINFFCNCNLAPHKFFTLCHLAPNKFFHFSLLAPNKIWLSTVLPIVDCMILFFFKKYWSYVRVLHIFFL